MRRFLATLLLAGLIGLGSQTNLKAQDLSLSSGPFDTCTLNLPLMWNAFTGWTNGVGSYEIWASQKSPASDFPGPAMLVGSVDEATTTYDFYADDGRQHCIQIYAISEDAQDTVISNQICHDLPIIQSLESIVLYNITVTPNPNEPDGTVYLAWSSIPDVNLVSSTIHRSRSGQDFVAMQNPNPSFGIYEDREANAHLGPVSYQISAIDGCGNEAFSNKASSIFLSGEINDAGEHVLQWTPYENEYILDGLFYHVLNEINLSGGSLAFQNPQASYPADIFQHMELVGPELGTVCYSMIVEPRLLHKGSFYYSTTSFSNQVCLTPTTPVYLPNAFAPNGVNREFKAFGLFGNTPDYFMQIFDRYGGLVFESNDVSQGWDGRKNGRPMPQGSYVYYIKMRQADDTLIERKGSVMLVR